MVYLEGDRVFMVKRDDLSRPRIRLKQGADPHKPLHDLHYGKSNVRITRTGELEAKPSINPKRWAPDEHGNQFIENAQAVGYCPDTGHEWEHSGGDRRPSFDRSHHHFKEPTGLKASGQDMTKSPFSAANKTWKD